MQRRERPAFHLAAVACGAAALLIAAGCDRGPDTGPIVGSVEVSLSRSRIALGSPVEVTYRFTLAPDAPALGARRVFVHFLDADDEMMWNDDHDPPTPTEQWKPGQTIEYTRTMFVPSYPYVGPAQVVTGLYEPAQGGRLRLANPDRGGRAYKVADFELLPQTENVFLIFKDGWHQTEVVNDGGGRTEWQWTRKEATVAFRNPKRDVIFFLHADNPAAGPNTAQRLEVRIGDQQVGSVALDARSPSVEKIPIAAAQLGTADMVEVRLVADKTFVPALEPGGSSSDTRELGARVFHAFVQ
jgi:hypothetical protein